MLQRPMEWVAQNRLIAAGMALVLVAVVAAVAILTTRSPHTSSKLANPSQTASGSVEAWMASPGHRANILDPAWRQIGIATASSPDAPDDFANLGVTVITTDFGVRS